MDPSWLADAIARAQRKDPAGFDALIDAYSRRLYGFLYRLTGRRDEAEDLLQEVFVRLVRMIDKYEHDGRFEAWLFRIAMNLARDRVRRIRKSPIVLAAEIRNDDAEDRSDEPLDRASGDRPGPAHAAELGEEIDRMQEAMGKLNPAEREVIMLRHFSEMSFNEIAELMGTPLGTALARAHRGLKRLREILEGTGAS